jgi:glycosyltransferase involved in cell wall biosynthesis
MKQKENSEPRADNPKGEKRGLRILMLGPAEGTRGPLPKHTPLLVGALRQAGCAVTTIPWGRLSDNESMMRKLIGRTCILLRVLRALRGDQFDIMLVKTAHNWVSLARDVPLALLSRGNRCRTVLQFHGSEPQKLTRPGGRAFKAATRLIIAPASAALVLCTEELVQWQEFFPRKRFYMVENAFVPNAAALEEERKPSGMRSQGRPVVLFVARLIPEKGPLDLLNAFSLVHKEMECELVIAGDGPVAEDLRGRIAEYGLEKDVTLAGYLEGKALWETYRRASIFALPTYFGEGFPTVFSEAMATGLPIVTTRVRGANDHLREGSNALFVPPREPQALAEALKRLLRDPQERARMGEANRQKVKDFAPEKVVRRYIQVFEDVLRERAI